MGVERTRMTLKRATGQQGNSTPVVSASCEQHVGNWATRQLSRGCREDQKNLEEGNMATGQLHLVGESFVLTACGHLGN